MSWRHPLPAACWEADKATTIIPVEAETPSDGVFWATHSGLPILQREKVDLHEGQVVEEQTLLAAVHSQPADYPVLPILGRSGAGKSHLVRWLRTNLDLEPTTRLVFVPKHRTSLRGIIELVLQHASGERAESLRRRVDEAVDALGDEQEARLRLRTELATLVETRGAQPGLHTGEEGELRAYLATALPALLLDPYFRQTLLREDGAIARLVREKLRGKAAEDKEDAFGFGPDDVRLSVDDVRHASRDAQDVAGALASDDTLPRLAARMLNEQLGQAVSAVFGLGGDDLKDLLVELRQALARRGEELLLLIEDFSIFQGIQGGLIDAITLIPSKELAICPMRAVIAVTTGYFLHQLPDTVKTRTYLAFDLDLPEDAEVRPDSAAFAAPYLNAVRVGQDDLDAAYATGDKLPNACDTCPVVARCHDAFGQVDGVGLFPFNTEALARAVRSKSGAEGAFIARDVLNRVLRPVLHRDREAVVSGEFPTDAFARDFATGAEGLLDIEDEARLERVGDPPATNERRKRLVRFWGTGDGPQNFNSVIHEAFDIPQVEGLETGARRPQASGPRIGVVPLPGPAAVSLPRAEAAPPMLVQALDHWIETGELSQRERNDIRRVIHGLVIERMELEDGLWSRTWWTDTSKLAPAFPHTAILLGEKGRVGETRQAILRIEGGGSTDARALRGWVWYSGTGSWRLVQNGATLQRLAYRKLDEWTRAVAAQLLPDRDARTDAELVALVHALELGGQVLGLGGAYREELEERVRALVDNGKHDAPTNERWPLLEPLARAALTGEVAAAADRTTLQTRLLRLASFSQPGKPLGLDISRITPALKDAGQLESAPEEVPDDVRRHIAVLRTRLNELDGLAEQMRNALPDLDSIGGDLTQVTAVVNGLLERVATSGLLPRSIEPAVVRQAGRDIRDGDVAAITKAREKLDAWDGLDRRDRLRLLTGRWYPPAVRVSAWITAAHRALTRLEEHLASDGGSHLGAEMSRAAADLREGIANASGAVGQLLVDDAADVVA